MQETVAIKQIELPSSGVARRYWWQHLEDDVGGLTDQPGSADRLESRWTGPTACSP
jgi:hypothetical protein